MTEAPLLRMETFNAELERTKDCAAEYGAIISYLRPDSDYEIVACPAQHVLVVMRGDRRYRDDIQHFIADHEHCSRRDDVDDTRHGSGSGHRQDPVPPSRECLRQMQALPAGWDSYGSEPITPASIEEAYTLIQHVIAVNRTLSPEILCPRAVVPLAWGGVQVEWHGLHIEIEVEVNPDRSFGYLISTPGSGKGGRMGFKEGNGMSLIEIVQRVSRVLTTQPDRAAP